MILLAMLLGFQTHASWDAVGVFYRPEKVIVLVNEYESSKTDKLKDWLAAFPGKQQIIFGSDETAVKFTCGRSAEKSGCTFRFLPAENVMIAYKVITASLPAEGLKDAGFVYSQNLDVSFLNSNGDQFRIWTEGGLIHFEGSKR